LECIEVDTTCPLASSTELGGAILRHQSHRRGECKPDRNRMSRAMSPGAKPTSPTLPSRTSEQQPGDVLPRSASLSEVTIQPPLVQPSRPPRPQVGSGGAYTHVPTVGVGGRMTQQTSRPTTKSGAASPRQGQVGDSGALRGDDAQKSADLLGRRRHPSPPGSSPRDSALPSQLEGDSLALQAHDHVNALRAWLASDKAAHESGRKRIEPGQRVGVVGISAMSPRGMAAVKGGVQHAGKGKSSGKGEGLHHDAAARGFDGLLGPAMALRMLTSRAGGCKALSMLPGACSTLSKVLLWCATYEPFGAAVTDNTTKYNAKRMEVMGDALGECISIMLLLATSGEEGRAVVAGAGGCSALIHVIATKELLVTFTHPPPPPQSKQSPASLTLFR
jgi:hypothetical protein